MFNAGGKGAEGVKNVFNAEGAEEQRDVKMPGGMRKWNFEPFRIGRKSCFGIKTERFYGKIRVIL